MRRSLLHAWACTALLVGLLECAQIPLLVLTRQAAHIPMLMAMSIMAIMPLAGLLALGWAGFSRLQARARIPAALGLAACVGALLYLPLWPEPGLATFAPLLLITAASALAFPWLTRVAEREALGRGWLGLFVAGLALSQLVNLYFRPGLNPGFHQWALIFTLGFGLLTFRATKPLLDAKIPIIAVLVFGVAGCFGLDRSRAEPLFLSYPTLGRGLSLVLGRSGIDPGRAIEPESMDAQRAWAVFDARTHMPAPLDPALVAGRNVLYVTIDSIRHDWTSLGDPKRDLTPHMRAFATAESSFDFPDAHSPAMGTFQSSSAALALRHPSTLQLSVGVADWNGRLHESVTLLPDVLGRAGYRTSWVGHNFDANFERWMLGLQSHFEQTSLHQHDKRDPEADVDINRLAFADLAAAKADGRPFFAWVFFVGPHAEYMAHYPGRPAKTPRELYEQELSFVDEQFQALLDELERQGLAEDTIVVLTGDHGEEFLEHGLNYHAQHACEISRHVPLVVRIPGAKGRRVEGPVSTLFAFAWLFRDQADPIKGFVDTALRESVSPILEATEGAVLGEHLGLVNMHSALVYEEHAVQFGFHARRFEVFDRKADPLELEALSPAEEAALPQLREATERYRGLRRAMRRFDLEGGLE